MIILHYSLGLPPYRSGGLTRYATDLMKEQIRQGFQVALIYPGGIDLSCRARYHKRLVWGSLTTFEIINPLPVPLYHGISQPLKFISDGKEASLYGKILDEVRPTVLHIHTLMGLSLGLLIEAKKRGIHIVMTTHDFYGLCLKCTFINREGKLCNGAKADRCAWCNQNAKSLLFLRFRNEPCVIELKNWLTGHFKNISTRKVSQPFLNDGTNQSIFNTDPDRLEQYNALISFYRELLSYVDNFHFNSSVTERQYRKALGNDIQGEVIPITNSNINDNRKKGFTCDKTLKMVFIGHTDAFKGFPLLKSVLMELLDYDWQLDVWGTGEGFDNDTEKIRYRGSYTANQLSEIYSDCSLVIVPSKWYETFSFVTLEALSYGVPVLVSDHVGAQTLVAEYDSNFIFHSREDLKSALKSIMTDRKSLMSYHDKILSLPWHHEMSQHCKDIEEDIYS